MYRKECALWALPNVCKLCDWTQSVRCQSVRQHFGGWSRHYVWLCKRIGIVRCNWSFGRVSPIIIIVIIGINSSSSTSNWNSCAISSIIATTDGDFHLGLFVLRHSPPELQTCECCYYFSTDEWGQEMTCGFTILRKTFRYVILKLLIACVIYDVFRIDEYRVFFLLGRTRARICKQLLDIVMRRLAGWRIGNNMSYYNTCHIL